MRERRLPFSLKTGNVVVITTGPNSKWTEPQTFRLLELWKEGYSASRAATALNNEFGTKFSRNAVISKLHRIGLTSPGGDGKDRRKTRFRKQQEIKAKAAKKERRPFDMTWPLQRENGKKRPFKPKEPWRSTHVEVVVPEDKRKSLIELEDNECRWPIGDPQEKGFHFCGAEHVKGQPYCPYHLNASSEIKQDGVASPYPLEGAQKKELEPA